jgi:hypothetical protein
VLLAACPSSGLVGSEQSGEKALFVLPAGELEALILFLEGRLMSSEPFAGSGVSGDQPGSVVGLDSLRSKTQRSDGEQLNGKRLVVAAQSLDLSYGVKPWRTTSVQDLGIPCGINGDLPTLCAGPLHLILGGLLVRRSARAPAVAPGTESGKCLLYGSSGHQSNGKREAGHSGMVRPGIGGRLRSNGPESSAKLFGSGVHRWRCGRQSARAP